jgi:hypothetical protein
VMNDYGCVQDVISLNLLMSANCGSGRVIEACNYLQTAKKFVSLIMKLMQFRWKVWKVTGMLLVPRRIFMI